MAGTYETQELWTPKDFAHHYLLSANDVRKKLRERRIPGATKPFGRWLIDIAEFRRAKEEERLNPPHPTNWKLIPLPESKRSITARRKREERERAARMAAATAAV